MSSLSPIPTHCADIFDGDELTNADLNVDVNKTIQYSCHVVGLVLSAFHNVFVADPNIFTSQVAVFVSFLLLNTKTESCLHWPSLFIRLLLAKTLQKKRI
jgi:hypothetical protein